VSIANIAARMEVLADLEDDFYVFSQAGELFVEALREVAEGIVIRDSVKADVERLIRAYGRLK
jgi:hypothetical protein